jgi:arsenate reductase-like glutaredoxin family protein
VRELLPGIEERNYSKVPLTADEVREIVTAAGGVARVLNATHAIAKERGWKASPPPVEEYVAAVVAEPNLLRRPIVVKDGRVVVGRDEAGWKSLA